MGGKGPPPSLGGCPPLAGTEKERGGADSRGGRGAGRGGTGRGSECWLRTGLQARRALPGTEQSIRHRQEASAPGPGAIGLYRPRVYPRGAMAPPRPGASAEPQAWRLPRS